MKDYVVVKQALDPKIAEFAMTQQFGTEFTASFVH